MSKELQYFINDLDDSNKENVSPTNINQCSSPSMLRPDRIPFSDLTEILYPKVSTTSRRIVQENNQIT